ncbi:Tex family protein [Sediminibacter sp. Hel_I_10]|uniref:Tex family protein n=1 Tax=Sediminibacter sp. Hel_I_10 TaxID=1392490 RepID=UPI00047B2242|nr:Tex family protein [Sediminibacter sp. Hel_I_10]
MINYIKKHTNLTEKSIKNTVALIQQDCTIPFISRYRKEATGNLDEVQVGDIVKFKDQFESLEKRKTAILKALLEQDVLTPELEAKVKACEDPTALEDLYLPFKKSRKTKAETARKNGLEPLAKILMSQSHDLDQKGLNALVQKFITSEVDSQESALEGARHIIAEWINERIDFRKQIRKELERRAMIVTKVVKSKKTEENAQKYRDYFEWEESLTRIPSHRLLAILRAETEGCIRTKIEIDHDNAIKRMTDQLIKSKGVNAEQIEIAITDAYKRLLYPSLSNEILQQAKQKADDTAISIFAKNLKQLLLGAPLGEKRVLAIDPGFRTGCKVVCLDENGDLKHNETIYPHAPKNDSLGAMKKISFLTEAHQIEAIAIGNGTASRETEALVKKIRFKHDIQVFVVSEAGASIYSASKIAREEFPNYDVTVRGSVSIGRRLQDPLAELVKIDAKSIGVGQYQHDVDQSKLQNELDMVVQSCVNSVGVNINTASHSLLSYVSGIGLKLAENIVKYRSDNGAFSSRKDIKNVSRLGEKAFEQAAGFLRIKAGQHPLDDSTVHPESYSIVEQMAKDKGASVSELVGNKAKLNSIDITHYQTKTVGLLTLKDILSELEKPGLDIREQAKVFSFNQNITSINDLQEGQLLPGIVNNITAFGCFVDVGIKESGLIHISNLSDGFVKDVNEHVHLQEQIIVKVLEVDVNRKRIQLKLHQG